MKIGTRSIMFGVHQFFYHPLTIVRAWRAVHGKWPNWVELVCIFCHDLGYWGLPNIDGAEGKQHPLRGAQIASAIVYRAKRLLGVSVESSSYAAFGAYWLCLGHSRFFAKAHGMAVSDLYAADKACILFEPEWFYLLRARLSGELEEFREGKPEKVWLKDYKTWVRLETCLNH